MIFSQLLIINIILTNRFLFFRATGVEKYCFLSKSARCRPRVQYDQYCTLLNQSDCRNFVRSPYIFQNNLLVSLFHC